MWQQIILRAMPLIVTLALTIILPMALRKRTHDLAVSGLLLAKEENDPDRHETLEYLLNWRDLIMAVITGLFVIEFSIAEKIVEKITSNHPQTVDWSIVIIIALVLFMPLALVSIWLLADKLGLGHVQSSRMYWFLFIGLVVPWYVGSFLISYFL